MIATWAIGEHATWADIEKRLAIAPFDIVVVVLLSRMTTDMVDIFKQKAEASSRITKGEALREGDLTKLTELKTIHEVFENKHASSEGTFICVHKAKVDQLVLTEYIISGVDDSAAAVADNSASSDGKAAASDYIEDCVQFAIVNLCLSTMRQRMEHINIAIARFAEVDTEYITAHHIDQVCDTLVRHKTAMMTGYFYNHSKAVERIATKANATMDRPFVQLMHQPRPWHCSASDLKHQGQINRSGGIEGLAGFPTYIITFAFYSKIQFPICDVPFFNDWNDAVAIEPTEHQSATMNYPSDFDDRLIDFKDLPKWPMNERGSAKVMYLGSMKMKKIDWSRWCPHVFQTCLWVGTSIPGQGSQAKFAWHGGGMKPTVQFGSALFLFVPVWIAIVCRFISEQVFSGFIHELHVKGKLQFVSPKLHDSGREKPMPQLHSRLHSRLRMSRTSQKVTVVTEKAAMEPQLHSRLHSRLRMSRTSQKVNVVTEKQKAKTAVEP